MRRKQIFALLYGGITVEVLLLIKKLKGLITTSAGINILGMGTVIPYWFLIVLGILPFTPMLETFFANKKEEDEAVGPDNDEILDEISELLSKYDFTEQEW